MTPTNRITALETLARANEARIRTLAAEGEELRNKNVQLEIEIMSLDPTESLLYCAIETGALREALEEAKEEKTEEKEPRNTSEHSFAPRTPEVRERPKRQEGEDEENETVWEDVDVRTPPARPRIYSQMGQERLQPVQPWKASSPVSPTSSMSSPTPPPLVPQARAPQTLATSTAHLHFLNLITCRPPCNTALGPASRSLAFAVSTVSGKIVEVPIPTEDLAFKLRARL